MIVIEVALVLLGDPSIDVNKCAILLSLLCHCYTIHNYNIVTNKN